MSSKASQAIRNTIQKDQWQDEPPLPQQRKEWEAYAQEQPLPNGITQREERIAGVPCLWVNTEHPPLQSQIIVYLHGGGYISGSPITHLDYAARLTLATSMPILLVDYRLAPEHPYPAALEDIAAVYQSLINQHEWSPSQIYFGGDSSGAGLLVASLLKLRDSATPLPAKAFCLSGVYDATFSCDSMKTRAEDDPFTSKQTLERCFALYAQGEILTTPLISPLFGELHGMPPFLLQAGNDEILRDDSARLASEIILNGGEVELRIWADMWHTWPLYGDFPEAKGAIEEIRRFLG